MKLLKFYADWCGPCRIMKPVVSKIVDAHNLELVEYNIDTDEGAQAAQEWGVTSIPTLVLVGQNTTTKFVGAYPQSKVEHELGLTVS